MSFNLDMIFRHNIKLIMKGKKGNDEIVLVLFRGFSPQL